MNPTRLLSLEQPALPVGYGFAVVTRDGRTLYHSDSRLGLRENAQARAEKHGENERARKYVFQVFHFFLLKN